MSKLRWASLVGASGRGRPSLFRAPRNSFFLPCSQKTFIPLTALLHATVPLYRLGLFIYLAFI